jgi:spermidine synthase
MWLHLNLIKQVMSDARKVFPVVEWGYTTIPTYPSGQIGFILCGKSAGVNFKQPLRSLPNQENKCRYYTSDIHSAAFILPQFAKVALELPSS